jgi:predicted P-loop ATPase
MKVNISKKNTAKEKANKGKSAKKTPVKKAPSVSNPAPEIAVKSQTPTLPAGYQNPAENYLAKKYEFRKNVITGKTEWRTKGSNVPFREMEDYTLNSLRRELQREDIGANTAAIKSLLNSDFVPRVDVIKTYFENLAAPVSGIDQIEALAETVKTTNQDLWKKCLKKWIVASVACAVNQEKVNQQVLVLVGTQGLGKTTWLHNLLPKGLKGYMYSGYVNPNNKDTLCSLTENLYINLDELGSLRRNDIDSLKELITKPTIQLRRAYAIYAQNYTRRASFMASVNHVNFLTDSTGSRRFLSFTATQINYNHGINLDALYYQAYQLYKNGFKYWFEGADIVELEANNSQYLELSMEQELVEKHFTPSDEMADDARTVTTTEIGRYLHHNDKMPFNNSSVQKIGAALRSLGYTRVKRQGVYKYIVKFKMKVAEMAA